jgi:hypothetical protein
MVDNSIQIDDTTAVIDSDGVPPAASTAGLGLFPALGIKIEV